MRSSAILQAGLLVALWTSAPASLLGWSEQGHRIVALAAQENLSDYMKRRLTYLFGPEPKLVDYATWADELAVTRLETEAWHSIAIPPDAEAVSLERDCPLGDCVTAKVRECIGIVRLSIRPKAEIVDAFKLMLGLAADMHQPLLNGYTPPHGKEQSIVVVDGEEISLLEAWDSKLLALMGSEEEILERVRRRIASADIRAWGEGTLKDWTWETHRMAVERVYPAVKEEPRTVLDESARSAASDLIVDQLAKSAVRFVKILEQTWL